jgi:hypothetical protein
LKKSLVSLTPRQDAIFRSLSEELEISLSELIRRALDEYIEGLVKDGTLVKFTWSSSDKSIDLEFPKRMFKELYDYVKSHPDGAIKLIE